MSKRNSREDAREFFQMVKVAGVLNRQDSAVYNQLNEPGKKEEVISRIKATYVEMGGEISDSQAERAYENITSKRWEFDPGQTGDGIGLWNAYIKRGWIAKNILLPGAAILTAGLIANGAVKHANEQRLLERETSIENKVETIYQQRVGLESEYQRRTSNRPGFLNGEEITKIGSLSNGAFAELNKTTPFLNTYCPEGEADDAVTRENMDQVEQELPTINSQLATGKTNLRGIEEVISTATECVDLKEKMTGLFVRFKETKPHKSLESRAETIYENGINYTQTRDLVEARKSFRGLSGIFSDSQTFNDLMGRLPNLYGAIKKSSKQDKAVKMGDEMYATGERAIETGNVNSLRMTTENMRDLLTTLNQSYTVEVLQRPGFKTALWRQSDDNPSRNTNDEDPEGKMFYVVCQARDKSSGAPIPVTLKNVETQQTDTVSIFGWRIPHEVYLRLKADKMDNGLLDNSAKSFRLGRKTIKIPKGIDNNKVSEKPLGYIDSIMIIPDNNGKTIENMGQITKEERGFRR